MNRESKQQLRLAIQRLARRIRSTTAEGEVTESQRSVLFTLDIHGRQSLGSLSQHERVTPPSMNRTVSALVAAGFVTRITSERDARRIEIDLSDAGRTFVRETRRQRDVWFMKQIAALSAEQRRILDEAVPVLRELSQK